MTLCNTLHELLSVTVTPVEAKVIVKCLRLSVHLTHCDIHGVFLAPLFLQSI